MQVSVEKISNVRRRLTIVVPANQVEEAYAKQIDYFVKNANIKGFRPGKAPLGVIQQRFGADARKEALNEVMRTALYTAIKEQNLSPVSNPQVEAKTMIANQPLEFIASFEVLPDIESVRFSIDDKERAVEKLNVIVTPEDVDYVVEQLRKQHIKWNKVDRPAQEKDRVVIDYYAINEGKTEPENKVENAPLELGSKTMLPGFEEGLLGASAGEERKLNLRFPEEIADPEKKGKSIEFIVAIKQVFEADVPTLNEDLVRSLGIKSGLIEDLKQQIKSTLEQERDRLVKDKLKEQIFKQLLEQNPLEVPHSLIVREATNIHDEIYPQHRHEGEHNHSDEETKAFNDIAQKRVALALLIDHYAKQVNLSVDKDKVRQRIQEIASAYENPQEVVQWLSDEERRSGIESQILEDQVLEKLMEGLHVTEKNMSYAELKGIRI